VLGELLDKSLRRGLVLSDGSLEPFFVRPICAALAAVTLFTMLMYIPAVNRWVSDAWRSFKALFARRPG
jgi:putative tricarboxylic transport membrane protein